jgi:hypothetical protein
MLGLKSVEQLIEKYGVSAFADDTPFLKRRRVTLGDAMQKGMPFCFFRRLQMLSPEDAAWCFIAYLPNKKQRMAMYLVDKDNNLIEQVYYLRDRKGVVACEKVQRLLEQSLQAANADKFVLAA